MEREAATNFGGALLRGFEFANELGQECGPVHLLVGIADGHGVAAEALRSSSHPLRHVVVEHQEALGISAAYLRSDAQATARWLVTQFGGPSRAEHLLIALLDQATPQILGALRIAGIDPAAARAAALADLGLPIDVQLTTPAHVPPGTSGRPPLPLGEIDAQAWAVLAWRQERLPLKRLRSTTAWQGLSAVEERAARRLAERLNLSSDQRHSLICRHRQAVATRLRTSRPDLAPDAARGGSKSLSLTPVVRSHRPHFWHLINIAAECSIWFQNRYVGIRDRWFWVTTLRHYRGAPRTPRQSL